jgi:CRP/FNR family transcriptional regulator, anaerobic regulatory protein
MNIIDRVLGLEKFFKKKDLPLLEQLATLPFSKKIKKGDHILNAGDVNKHIFYVQSGLFRVYLLNDDKEVNTWFVQEGEFITSLKSFHKEIPTNEYIQALEDSVVLTIRKDIAFMVLKNNHKFALFAIDELFDNLCEYSDQCDMLRYMTSEKRYLFLKEKKPKILNRLSQKHLASYIGVDSTYLSKIVNQFKNLDEENSIKKVI